MTFDAPRVTVGRSSSCDIQVPFRVVSGHHLTFQRAGRNYRLQDVDTTNGTELDGAPLPPGEWVEVEDGMELRVVDVTLRVMVEREDPDLDAFTLAESGTLARRLLSDALAENPGDSAHLQVVEGPEQGRRFELPDDLDEAYAGSSEECSVHLPEGTEAKHAARFTFERRGFCVEPTGPAPLRLGGDPIASKTLLSDGDRVGLDQTVLEFRDPLESHLRELEELEKPSDANRDPGAEQAREVPADASSETSPPLNDGPVWGAVEIALLAITLASLGLVAAVLLVTFGLV